MIVRSGIAPVYRSVTAFGPASLSNLGPGFDTVGLCLQKWGDRITAKPAEHTGVRISYAESSDWIGPTDTAKNTAGVAAESVLTQIGYDGGIQLEIDKGIVPGSGSGSSAASAVAAVVAVNGLFDSPLSRAELVSHALKGEAIASGTQHGDNILPSLFGGVVIAASTDPTIFSLWPFVDGVSLSVVLPAVKIETRHARLILPDLVPLTDAVQNASSLAFLLDALRTGAWRRFGEFIMTDRLVEPVRATLLPVYKSIRRAALEAGAFGCALSGSGPTMFAVSDSSENAEMVVNMMIQACENDGITASGMVSTIDRLGSHIVDTSRI